GCRWLPVARRESNSLGVTCALPGGPHPARETDGHERDRAEDDRQGRRCRGGDGSMTRRRGSGLDQGGRACVRWAGDEIIEIEPGAGGIGGLDKELQSIAGY